MSFASSCTVVDPHDSSPRTTRQAATGNDHEVRFFRINADAWDLTRRHTRRTRLISARVCDR